MAASLSRRSVCGLRAADVRNRSAYPPLPCRLLNLAYPGAATSDGRAATFNRNANAAAVLLTLKRNQEAASAATKALSVFSDSASSWYIRGQALLLMGNTADAEHSLQQSAALEPNVATLSALADVYRSQGRYAAAENCLEQLVAISPHPTAALVLLGYLYLQTNQPREALQTFNRADAAVSPAEGRSGQGRDQQWTRIRLSRSRRFAQGCFRARESGPAFAAKREVLEPPGAALFRARSNTGRNPGE